MRTTIDLPEDLLRRAKATAALRGLKLKDLVARLLDAGLSDFETSPGRPGREEIPVTLPAAGRQFNVLSHSKLMEALDGEDELGRSA